MPYEFVFPTTEKYDAIRHAIEAMMQRSRHLFCAGYLDQGKMIGDDPIGNKCSNDGTRWYWTRGVSFRVCDACHAHLLADNGRVTFDPLSLVVGHD